METANSMYKGHRFPSDVIQYAVWVYFRFNLSIRDVEDLLAQRGIIVSYEAIRLLVNKFGPKYAQKLRKKQSNFGDTYFIDEVFVKIDGIQHYLWRAVAQDGDIVDVFMQTRRDSKAAKRFFKRILRSGKPRVITTDKLRSYNVAHREIIPDVFHESRQYANNKSKLSHQPTRVRERIMRKFKSIKQADRFLNCHKEIYNLFNLGRHLMAARYYRDSRQRALASWNQVTAA